MTGPLLRPVDHSVARMGTYMGHADEALLFLTLAIWWMYNTFPAYIRASQGEEPFRSHVSYTWPGRPRLAIESFLKLAFPLAGVCFELFINRPQMAFFDADGNFVLVDRLQHISIFALFAIHGVVDLLSHLGAPFPRALSGITMALAFFWFGLMFILHEDVPDKSPMEVMTHILPTYAMFGVAWSILVEAVSPTLFAASLAKTFFMIVLGTWFWHTSAIMYLFKPFPGRIPNPAWDRHDPRNAHFLVALMGFHLTFSLAALLLLYLLTVAWLRIRACCVNTSHPATDKHVSQEICHTDSL